MRMKRKYSQKHNSQDWLWSLKATSLFFTLSLAFSVFWDRFLLCRTGWSKSQSSTSAFHIVGTSLQVYSFIFIIIILRQSLWVSQAATDLETFLLQPPAWLESEPWTVRLGCIYFCESVCSETHRLLSSVSAFKYKRKTWVISAESCMLCKRSSLGFSEKVHQTWMEPNGFAGNRLSKVMYGLWVTKKWDENRDHAYEPSGWAMGQST